MNELIKKIPFSGWFAINMTYMLLIHNAWNYSLIGLWMFVADGLFELSSQRSLGAEDFIFVAVAVILSFVALLYANFLIREIRKDFPVMFTLCAIVIPGACAFIFWALTFITVDNYRMWISWCIPPILGFYATWVTQSDKMNRAATGSLGLNSDTIDNLENEK